MGMSQEKQLRDMLDLMFSLGANAVSGIDVCKQEEKLTRRIINLFKNKSRK